MADRSQTNPLARLLRRTPQSTDRWSCPWFRLIAAVALIGVIVSLATDAALRATVCGLVVGFLFGSRS